MKTYTLPTPVDGQDTWRDGKRYLWLFGLLVPMLPFLAIGLHAATGWTATLWLGPVVLLGIVPMIDLIAGFDPTNPPEQLTAVLEQDRYYRWIVYVYIPIQYAGFIVAMW